MKSGPPPSEDARDVRSGGSGGRRRLRRLLLAMGVLLPCPAREGRGWPWSTPSFLRFWWRPGSGSEYISALEPLRNILNSTRVCLVPITPRKGVLHVRYRSISCITPHPTLQTREIHKHNDGGNPRTVHRAISRLVWGLGLVSPPVGRSLAARVCQWRSRGTPRSRCPLCITRRRRPTPRRLLGIAS